MAREAGFTPVKELFDTKQWFMDAVWVAKLHTPWFAPVWGSGTNGAEAKESLISSWNIAVRSFAWNKSKQLIRQEI